MLFDMSKPSIFVPDDVLKGKHENVWKVTQNIMKHNSIMC
jgi:hypothetical protein